MADLGVITCTVPASGTRTLSLPHMAGPGRISGTVTVAGSPASRWVVLYHRASLRILRMQQSAADGSYSFTGLLTTERYGVLCVPEPADQANVIVYNDLTPVP